jgi:hypothetical protein
MSLTQAQTQAPVKLITVVTLETKDRFPGGQAWQKLWDSQISGCSTVDEAGEHVIGQGADGVR